MRRRALVAGLSLAAVAAAVAVPIALLAGDGNSTSREEYLAEVNAVCSRYERRLARIDAPISFANPAAVKASLDQVLPVLARRSAEVRAVEPPAADEDRVRSMLARSDSAIEALRAMRAAAVRADLPAIARALERFLRERDAARAEAQALGVTC